MVAQPLLHRYWLRFRNLPTPSALALGCGITAFSYEDATNILKQTVFRGIEPPSMQDIIEDVAISTLDQAHVIPNMGAPNVRGIWYPLGYSFPK